MNERLEASDLFDTSLLPVQANADSVQLGKVFTELQRCNVNDVDI
jgi:hypothetical protein